jgi:hypothetical protein
MNATPLQLGQQMVEFAKTNQGISSDKGDMQRTVLVH